VGIRSKLLPAFFGGGPFRGAGGTFVFIFSERDLSFPGSKLRLGANGLSFFKRKISRRDWGGKEAGVASPWAECSKKALREGDGIGSVEK